MQSVYKYVSGSLMVFLTDQTRGRYIHFDLKISFLNVHNMLESGLTYVLLSLEIFRKLIVRF